MRAKIKLLTLCTALLLFSGVYELKAQDTHRNATTIRDISEQLTSNDWVYVAKGASKQDVVSCLVILEFRLDGQALWHPVCQKIPLADLMEFSHSVNRGAFRNGNYTSTDSYKLEELSSKENEPHIYSIFFEKERVSYVIEQISDSVLVLKYKDLGKMIFISAGKLDKQDFVVGNSNLVQSDTTIKRIRGVLEVNAQASNMNAGFAEKEFSLGSLVNYRWTAILQMDSDSTSYACITWLFENDGTRKLAVNTAKSLESIKSFKKLWRIGEENSTFTSPQELSNGKISHITLINTPEEIVDLSDSLLVFSYPSKDVKDDSYNIFYIREDYLSDINFVKRHITNMPRDSVKRIRGVLDVNAQASSMNAGFAGGQDLYKVLEIKQTEDVSLIHSQYGKLYGKYHPYYGKKNADPLKLKYLNQAYLVLKNPDTKRIYDMFGIDSLSAYEMLPPDTDIIAYPRYRDYSLNTYMFLFHLKRTIRYPKFKEYTEPQTSLVLSLMVTHDSFFKDIEIDQSCGCPALDQAVVKALYKMSGLKYNKIVPAYDLSGNPIDLHVTIEVPASYLSKSSPNGPINPSRQSLGVRRRSGAQSNNWNRDYSKNRPWLQDYVASPPVRYQ